MPPSFLVADLARNLLLTKPGRLGGRTMGGLRVQPRKAFREERMTEVISDLNKWVRFGRESLAVRQRRVVAVGEDESEKNCSLHA